MQTNAPPAQISIRFDATQLAKLRALAEAEDRSLAYVVRSAVDGLPEPSRTITQAASTS